MTRPVLALRRAAAEGSSFDVRTLDSGRTVVWVEVGGERASGFRGVPLSAATSEMVVAGADAARRSLASFAAAATLAHALGLGVNAGHDLDLGNLAMFRALPFLDEVSIGHAIMSRALLAGLATVVREYLQVLGGV